ncbi:MAG: rod shape-determining protein RodA, partial [Burkholderiaceae bacterium]|nr:rod shape-determining protein RodA [Burkholderiaceae bacterium]
MNAVFNKPSLWQRLKPMFSGFDLPLLLAIGWMMGLGLLSMYSAGYDHGTRFVDHSRNMLISIALIFLVAQIPPQRIMQLAIPLYTVGIVLLLATALFGITKKGATRWLNIGVTQIQPSELLKIATPLMLAWWFQKREGLLRLPDFIAAFVLLAIPTLLVAKQPDLGTSILVASAGLYVIFFAGLSWKLIIPAFIIGAASITTLVMSEEKICQPDVEWPVLREYQKNRVCTLLDPTKDPLGKGFHIIQGEIAIGSGGITGKGFMKGTQTHLEFIPERTTDFIFAAFGEEFGLAGALALLAGFTALILR